MKEVVAMARMVPMGIDFWASRRSPDRLEPAMIPEGGRSSLDMKLDKVYHDVCVCVWSSHR